MNISPSLIAKGASGLTAASAATGAGIYFNENISEFLGISKTVAPEVLEQTVWNEEAIKEKIGLDCTTNNNDCTIIAGKKINIIDGQNKRTNISEISGGKIKLHKDAGEYAHNLKFSIEESKITLTNGEDSGGGIAELPHNSTYEIKKEVEGGGEKWYLSRKITQGETTKKLREEKNKSLGLPNTDNCKLPEDNNPKNCSISNDQLKNINFLNKTTGNPTPSSFSGNLTLKIEKVTGEPNVYGTENLKFTFTNIPQSVSIPGSTTIELKKGTEPEFKIKENNNKWYLERVWSVTELSKQINLTCSNGSNECTIGNSLNVFEGDSKKITGANKSAGGNGKIKFEENQEGYNQGYKFTIEDKDINLSGGNSSISKLEEFATYEIKKQSDGTWYFSRKTSAIEEKSKLLGLPEGCKLPENDSVTCRDIDANKLNAINFDGKKSTETPTIDGDGKTTLTISKTGDVERGYKFVFDCSKELTIPGDSDPISVKKNTNTEFKIKKEGKKLMLKKSWNKETIKEKIGLDCKNSSSSGCSINKSINVMDGNKKKKEIKTLNSSTGKIKFHKDVEGYNQGFKFIVESEKITLTDGIQEGDRGDITELEVGSEYEIKLEENTWYLSKKTA